jgi:hypothetical protein
MQPFGLRGSRSDVIPFIKFASIPTQRGSVTCIRICKQCMNYTLTIFCIEDAHPVDHRREHKYARLGNYIARFAMLHHEAEYNLKLFS